MMGFVLCCNTPDRNLRIPTRRFPPAVEAAKLKYYNADVHSAAFVLPQFAKAALGL